MVCTPVNHFLNQTMYFDEIPKPLHILIDKVQEIRETAYTKYMQLVAS